MPKRSNDFQKLIHFLETQLSPGATVTESKEVAEDDTGDTREIDVAIEGDVGGHEVFIGVECRDHARPGDKTWIDGLIGKYERLPVDKVVAVAAAGFTKGAAQKAQANGIALYTIEEALETNWIPVMQPMTIPLSSFEITRIMRVNVIPPLPPDVGPEVIPDDPTNTIIVHRADGSPIGNMRQLAQSASHQAEFIDWASKNSKPNEDTPITYNVSLGEGSYWTDAQGEKREIIHLKVFALLRHHATEISFSKHRYRQAEILRGTANALGREVELTAVYQDGQDTKIGLSVKKKKVARRSKR